MMKEYIASYGQTFDDVSIRLFGSCEFATEIAWYNNMSLDSMLMSGMVIKLPSIEAKASSLVKYFTDSSFSPSTSSISPPSGGIGSMGIEVDFTIK